MSGSFNTEELIQIKCAYLIDKYQNKLRKLKEYKNELKNSFEKKNKEYYTNKYLLNKEKEEFQKEYQKKREEIENLLRNMEKKKEMYNNYFADIFCYQQQHYQCVYKIFKYLLLKKEELDEREKRLNYSYVRKYESETHDIQTGLESLEVKSDEIGRKSNADTKNEKITGISNLGSLDINSIYKNIINLPFDEKTKFQSNEDLPVQNSMTEKENEGFLPSSVPYRNFRESIYEIYADISNNMKKIAEQTEYTKYFSGAFQMMQSEKQKETETKEPMTECNKLKEEENKQCIGIDKDDKNLVSNLKVDNFAEIGKKRKDTKATKKGHSENVNSYQTEDIEVPQKIQEDTEIETDTETEKEKGVARTDEQIGIVTEEDFPAEIMSKETEVGKQEYEDIDTELTGEHRIEMVKQERTKEKIQSEEDKEVDKETDTEANKEVYKEENKKAETEQGKIKEYNEIYRDIKENYDQINESYAYDTEKEEANVKPSLKDNIFSRKIYSNELYFNDDDEQELNKMIRQVTGTAGNFSNANEEQTEIRNMSFWDTYKLYSEKSAELQNIGQTQSETAVDTKPGKEEDEADAGKIENTEKTMEILKQETGNVKEKNEAESANEYIREREELDEIIECNIEAHLSSYFSGNYDPDQRNEEDDQGIVEGIEETEEVNCQFKNEVAKGVRNQVANDIQDEVVTEVKDKGENEVENIRTSEIENEVQNIQTSEIENEVENIQTSEIENEVDIIRKRELKNEATNTPKDEVRNELENGASNELDDIEPNELDDREPNEMDDREPNEMDDRELNELNDREPNELDDREPNELDKREPNELDKREPNELEYKAKNEIKDDSINEAVKENDNDIKEDQQNVPNYLNSSITKDENNNGQTKIQIECDFLSSNYNKNIQTNIFEIRRNYSFSVNDSENRNDPTTMFSERYQNLSNKNYTNVNVLNKNAEDMDVEPENVYGFFNKDSIPIERINTFEEFLKESSGFMIDGEEEKEHTNEEEIENGKNENKSFKDSYSFDIIKNETFNTSFKSKNRTNSEMKSIQALINSVSHHLNKR